MLQTKNTILGKAKVYIFVFFTYYLLMINSLSDNHSRTENLKFYTQNADIVVSAIGVPNFLKGDMIKEGAVIIDVGINRVDDNESEKGYRIVGDADLQSMIDKVSYITPVPGGVGPMTIAMLLYNTVVSAESQLS